MTERGEGVMSKVTMRAVLERDRMQKRALELGSRIAYELYPGSKQMTTGTVVSDGSDGFIAYATDEANPPTQRAGTRDTKWWPLIPPIVPSVKPLELLTTDGDVDFAAESGE